MNAEVLEYLQLRYIKNVNPRAGRDHSAAHLDASTDARARHPPRGDARARRRSRARGPTIVRDARRRGADARDERARRVRQRVDDDAQARRARRDAKDDPRRGASTIRDARDV